MTQRTDDYDAIVRVICLYIDAFNDNDAASVQLNFDSEKSGGGWIDFHNLVRIDAWKITNKTATHCSR